MDGYKLMFDNTTMTEGYYTTRNILSDVLSIKKYP
jgi:hypothetical protein